MHLINRKTIYRILNNAIKQHELNDKYCDLVGKEALIKIVEELQLSLDEHIDNYNNYKNDNEDEGELDYAFGHMLIYQLIRFWDSRYYMGKFLEEYDAPRSNLQLTFVNENGLKQYMKSYQIIKDCIKNELMDMEQWNLFQQYIVEYNGQSLFHDNVNEFKKTME